MTYTMDKLFGELLDLVEILKQASNIRSSGNYNENLLRIKTIFGKARECSLHNNVDVIFENPEEETVQNYRSEIHKVMKQILKIYSSYNSDSLAMMGIICDCDDEDGGISFSCFICNSDGGDGGWL